MKNFTYRRFFPLVLVFTLVLLCACGAKVKDYSSEEAYTALFSDADDAETKNLKNLLIAQNEAYNAGDAEGYYVLFDMTDDDLAFNIANFRSMRQNCLMTDTLESLETAFINEENAQALLTMTAYGENADTGEVLYHYRRTVTYTLKKNGKHWKITEQSDEGILDDLMDAGAE